LPFLVHQADLPGPAHLLEELLEIEHRLDERQRHARLPGDDRRAHHRAHAGTDHADPIEAGLRSQMIGDDLGVLHQALVGDVLGFAVAVARPPVMEAANREALLREQAAEPDLLLITGEQLGEDRGAEQNRALRLLGRSVQRREDPFGTRADELDVLADAGLRIDPGGPGRYNGLFVPHR
jgi:hypothetical protein